MKRTLLAFAIPSLLVACASLSARAQQVLDGIAAVVNEDVITFSQVRELIGSAEAAARQQLKGTELDNKIK